MMVGLGCQRGTSGKSYAFAFMAVLDFGLWHHWSDFSMWAWWLRSVHYDLSFPFALFTGVVATG
jgi:hypothetical protein